MSTKKRKASKISIAPHDDTIPKEIIAELIKRWDETKNLDPELITTRDYLFSKASKALTDSSVYQKSLQILAKTFFGMLTTIAERAKELEQVKQKRDEDLRRLKRELFATIVEQWNEQDTESSKGDVRVCRVWTRVDLGSKLVDVIRLSKTAGLDTATCVTGEPNEALRHAPPQDMGNYIKPLMPDDYNSCKYDWKTVRKRCNEVKVAVKSEFAGVITEEEVRNFNNLVDAWLRHRSRIFGLMAWSMDEKESKPQF